MNCVTCESSETCTACDKDYELKDGKCVTSGNSTVWIVVGSIIGVIVGVGIIYAIKRNRRKDKKSSLLS